jgi:hypothetical protein
MASADSLFYSRVDGVRPESGAFPTTLEEVDGSKSRSEGRPVFKNWSLIIIPRACHFLVGLYNFVVAEPG